jgi:hypothetical protein
MATINLGRIKSVWRGTWATGTAYVKDDVVQEGVNSYICTTAHTAGATFAGDSANWDLMAQGAEIPSQSGNAGLALKTDGTNLSWGQAGGMVKLGEFNSNNVASVTIQDYFTSDYKVYKLIVHSISGQWMKFRIKNTAGNTLTDGNYVWVNNWAQRSTSGGNNSDAGVWGSDYGLVQYWNNNNNDNMGLEITIYDPLTNNPQHIQVSAASWYNSELFNESITNIYAGSVEMGGIMIYPTGGIVETFRATLYGLVS